MEESQVMYDFSKEWSERLLKLIDTIDSIKQNLITNKELIITLSERLRALYVLLSPKLTKDEIKVQKNFNRILSDPKLRIFGIKRLKDSTGDIINQKVINNRNFNKVRNLLEKREMTLNISLERLGLTAKHKEKKVKIR